jgi:CheY-like chemotaxis protein
VALILIVEDEPFIRQVADWTIGDMGHATLVADDLATALDHLGGLLRIDALFVDIRLHALAQGGYEIADRAIGMRPALRVLYTSGTPLCIDMTDRFIAGSSFLQKPYTAAQLEQSIELLLH